MKTKLPIIVAILLTPFLGIAQGNSEEKSIEDVIVRLFKGMELADSAMVRTTFTRNPTTATVFVNKAGVPQLHQDSGIQKFLESIAAPRNETYYEEIWNLRISVDGNLAQAWCDYAFYIDNNFHHCGVDAFQLFKGADGWKIFHLADTRRTAGCDIPQDVQNKHKK